MMVLGAAGAAGQTPAATNTTLAVTAGGNAATSVSAGTVVTLTAKVQAEASAVTKGQVNFCDASAKYCTDVHLLGTAQLTSAGTAVLKLRPGIGSHSYKAVFVGTATDAGSVSAASALAGTGTIPPLATATTIDQAGSWGAYTLSTTVSESGNTAPPTGSVSFLDSNHGNALLASGSLGHATQGAVWNPVNTTASNVAGVAIAVADLNMDGKPDLFIKDYFGTYNVLLGNGDGTFTVVGSPFGPASGGGLSGANSFVIGDFNNDGIPDVAAIDWSVFDSSGTITIFLGNGDGTFTVAGTSPALGYNPTAIATADINGDGNADLVVVEQGTASSANGEVVVFFGNGDGTFAQASTTTSVTSTADSLIPADINNDGHADLVLTGGANTILLGKGDGTFTTVAGPSQVGGATAVVADVNHDGFPDMVFTAGGTSYLTVMLGNGDGTFTAAPESANKNVAVNGAMAIADINQDGVPDVVYMNSYGETAGVFFGNGDGTFQPVTTFPLPYAADGIVAADFNGDGWPDILTQGNDRTVAAYLTTPTQTATASATVAIAAAGQHLAEASYPGDSNYDASTSGTVSLWGVPPATATSLTLTSGGNAVSSVTAGTAVTLSATVTSGGNPVTAGQVNFCDASAATCTDIHLLGTAVLSSSGSAAFKYVPGAGTHSYKAVYVESGFGLSSSSGAVSLTVGPAPAPVYSDSTSISDRGTAANYSLTATVTGYGGPASPTGSVSFLDTSFGNTSLGSATLGSGTPGIGWLVSQTSSVGSYPASEVTADFNGDGIPDLAVVSSNAMYGSGSYALTILLGKGDGTFTAGSTTQLTTVQQGATLVSGDFNGDGKTDLAVLNGNGFNSQNSVTVLLGNGDGTFAAPVPTGLSGNSVNVSSGVAADFNGDGKLDLAVVVNNNTVEVLLGKGDGSFATPTAAASNQDFGQIAAGDFNGDGIPDLIVSNHATFGASPSVFLGKGDGTFTESTVSFTLDYFPTSVVVGDFNGDGHLDLAFADLNGVEIALGNGDGTFKETSASPIVVPSELYSLVVGDFNHDGKPDLAGIDNYDDRIVLLLGGGDGTFSVTATTPAASQSFIGPFDLVAADFNEDGTPDLAMLTKNTATATILQNEPTQTATATISGIAPVGAGTHNVEASYGGDSNFAASTSGTVALQAGLTPVTISPASGTYTTAQTVTLSESIPGSTIYYSATGPITTNGFVAYTGPIVLNLGGKENITAYARETGYFDSQWTTATFTLNMPAAPTPVITPAGGSYAGTQTVTISDAAAGATIYYTTDGSVPWTQATVYSGPITISSSATVSAIATAPGYSQSGVASSQYIIDSVPSAFIYTVAGSDAWGYGGDGGPATFASFGSVSGVVLDSQGDLYIADEGNSVIRKVAAGTGIISTVAGTGLAGYSGDNGPAVSAQLSFPVGLALDSAGNLYVADAGNRVIREIAAGTGVITTYAGSTSAKSLGDGGPATSAEFTSPAGLALDSAGNLYIADSGRVRKVTASTGVITTVAGGGNWGNPGENGPATQAYLGYIEGLAFDSAGNLYLVDESDQVIRKVNASNGTITTVVGPAPTSNGYAPGAFGGDGGPATQAKLNYPTSIAFDSAGNLYLADTFNGVIREVSNGIINTVAGHAGGCTSLSGDGGPALDTGICYPTWIAMDRSGNLFVAENGSGRIREITTPALPPTKATATPTFSVAPGAYGTAQTVSISDSTPGAEIYLTVNGKAPTTTGAGYQFPIQVTGTATLQAVAAAPGFLPSAAATATYTLTTPPSKLIKTVAGEGGVSGLTGPGGLATSSLLGEPQGVAVDGSGNLYVADSWDEAVWKVAAGTGTLTVVAGTPSSGGVIYNNNGILPTHVAVDAAGNLYISDTVTQAVLKVDAKTGSTLVYAGGKNAQYPGVGDGGPATSANLSSPQGLTLDGAGNLYIADQGHNRIRMVSASTGIITTVAGGGSKGLGDGGLATTATLSGPMDVAIDSSGNLYIADTGNNLVRGVNASTGIITTLAGNGLPGTGGDGGAATATRVTPEGLALDGTGNLYISSAAASVRKIPVAGGTITTVAGVGYRGFSGDGGAATVAELNWPSGLAVDKAGNLFIADALNSVVREVYSATPAATPAITPAGGTYTAAQTVTISDTTPGATIYYTTDGSTPSSGSTAYSGPVTVASSETLKAVAFAPGYTESAAAVAAYTITPPAAAPTFSPAAGSYAGAQNVTLADASTGAAIYYTTDGSTPTTSSAQYAGPIAVASSETINAIASGGGYSTSPVATAAYTITQSNPAPVINKLTPASVSAGGAAFSLVVNGSGFISGSSIYWGTTSLATQYVSASELKAQVPAAQIASAGKDPITVQSPAPGGGTSNTFQFEVDSAGSAPPSFTTVSATVTAGGTASYSVTLPSSATSVAVTCLNLPSGASCSYASNSGTLTIATSASTPKGTYQITAVFSETLPGSAASGLIVLPFLLLPIVVFRRRWLKSPVWILALVAVAMAGAAVSGCGGGGSSGSTGPTNPTYQATSSGTVSLTVQ